MPLSTWRKRGHDWLTLIEWVRNLTVNAKMGDVTRLLDQWNAGDAEALKALVVEVYAELRRIAGGLLRDERVGHTLQPTACTTAQIARTERPRFTTNISPVALNSMSRG